MRVPVFDLNVVSSKRTSCRIMILLKCCIMNLECCNRYNQVYINTRCHSRTSNKGKYTRCPGSKKQPPDSSASVA